MEKIIQLKRPDICFTNSDPRILTANLNRYDRRSPHGHEVSLNFYSSSNLLFSVLLIRYQMDVSVFCLLLMKKSWKLSMLLSGQIVFDILTTKISVYSILFLSTRVVR